MTPLETWGKITIVISIVLSVGLLSFFLSDFTFKKLSNNSLKRTRLLSWLTTLILTPGILCLIAYSVFKPKVSDLKDSVDGWEIKTTYQVYPLRTISVVDKRFKMATGGNNVLVVSRELTPVVKVGQSEPTDLKSIRHLVIELSPSDTLINPTNLGSSKILREILAFSPNYGTHPLNKDEKIEIRKIAHDRSEINSDLVDFPFTGVFSFSDSSRVTTRYIDKW